jgi:hypothetical protein
LYQLLDDAETRDARCLTELRFTFSYNAPAATAGSVFFLAPLPVSGTPTAPEAAVRRRFFRFVYLLQTRHHQWFALVSPFHIFIYGRFSIHTPHGFIRRRRQ